VRWGVVTFPGSNDDRDAESAIARVLGDEAVHLWHKDRTLGGVDCVILPGGFSYGDYLRCGAIARFSPIMEAVVAHARAGGAVLGICNGFQVLCEAGLLPGALVANRTLRFVCRDVRVRVETVTTAASAYCRVGDVLMIPVKHGEGCYVASEETLRELLDEERVVFRYCDAHGRVGPESNPNGSLHDIAGVCNEGRNVVGMMPHPEHAVDRLLGSDDGMRVLRSIQAWLERRGVVGQSVAELVPGP
jgi:phosphoribosylformylglycinamidine synthase I